MDIIACPHCSRQILPLANGHCPSCQQVADPAKALAAVAAEQLQPVVRLPETNLNALQIQQRRRARAGTFHAMAASLWFALALIVITAIVLLVIGIQNMPVVPGAAPLDLKTVMLLAGWIAGGCIYFGLRSVRKSRRAFLPDARLAVLRDKRCPVVYLRSVKDDESQQLEIRLSLKTWDRVLIPVPSALKEEDTLSTLRRCLGPVVAPSRQSEPISEIGAHSLRVVDEQWQAEVLDLMAAAQLVVLRLGPSHGLLWEFKALSESVPPDRILFFFEPPGTLPAHMQQLLPQQSLPLPSAARFLHFNENWQPVAADSLEAILRSRKLFKPDLYVVYGNVVLMTLIVISITALVVWVGGELLFG